MSSRSSTVLLVEDSAPMARVYMEYLSKEPLKVTHVASGTAAKEAIRKSPPEVILLDLRLPDMDGMEIMDFLSENEYPSSVVVITAHGSVAVAVEAMQKGAGDFLLKPFDRDRLVVTVRNLFEHRRLSEEVRLYREEFNQQEFCGFIGSSPIMQGIYRIVGAVAKSMATVFITGQSGTGKEVCAEAIHRQSERRGAFVALNCAAIPLELMESEIFGHVKGAFTGAVGERDGAATRADGGTLFFDEICDMDLSLQAKLLRFIQSGAFLKVGGERLQKVDVRFVCATNKDPWAEVEAGRFREDLYYRLHVVPIHMPPLAERGDDILEITRYFLLRFAQEEGKAFTDLAQDAQEAVLAYDWPGNVREVQNAIRNAVVLNDGDTLTARMLPALRGKGRAPVNGAAVSPDPRPTEQNRAGREMPTNAGLRPMADIEMEHIRKALQVCDNNVPKAAALLEISPSTIYRRLRD